MRLIDADKENERLLDFIAEHDVAIQNALEHKDMTLLEGIFDEYFIEQPTAYDVDKVVEQLETMKNHKGFAGTLQEMFYDLGIDEVIEIVKGGGVE